MSQREGHEPGGAVAPTCPNDRPNAVPGTARASAPPSSTEEVVPSLPIHLQQKKIEPNGRPADSPHEGGPMDVVRPFIQRALAGDLPPVELATPIDAIDSALDDLQRDAVARALQIEGLFVIRGPVGTGKTRVGIEIARQVIRRGGRVLWLSPEPSTLDGLLLRMSADLAVVRRVGTNELLEQLPREVAAHTWSARRAQLRTKIEQRAAQALAEASEKLRHLEAMRPIWARFFDVQERQSRRRQDQEAKRARKGALTEDVRREAESASDSAPYYVQRLRGAESAHAKRLATLDAAAADLRTQRQAAEVEWQTCESECQSLKPKADAIEHGRWYTLTFWKARTEGAVVERLSQTVSKLAGAKAKLDRLIDQEQNLASERQRAEQEHAAERTRFLQSEIDRREGELTQSIEQTGREIEQDGRIESELRTRLVKAGMDPDLRSAGLEAELERAKRDHALAQRAAVDMAARLDELVEEAASHVDVVAGPLAGIGDDAETKAQGPFDTIIIDDAHRLAEPDFAAAAQLARRWVLIGEPVEVASGRGRLTRPEFFSRLAISLRHEVWVQDDRNLVCRLYAVRGADRRRLECEPVADAPEIELRLFNPPGGEPTLAEVAFPITTPAATAREYLFREMGEITCQPRCRTVHWEDDVDGLVARFGPADPSTSFAAIGPGIGEELVGLETCALRFDSEWTLDRAAAWVAENVGRRETGRIVQLTRPQRACPGLARWLNRAFDIGFNVSTAIDDVAHVEFLAVPDTDSRRRHESRHHANGRVGGAGYEIDLADSRRRAALPADCADLPANGFVNVPEAQALVRYLENQSPGTNIAVTSPFTAQTIVLRRLIARSHRLASVKVLDVADAAQHECDVLAVSLTRSHVARAVTFGEGPGILASLLGRARKKVLFAGDPGTLARRLQWEGPVDHLDANDAARERGWVAALADCPRVAHPRHRSLAEAAR